MATDSWHNPERQTTSFEAITVSTTAVGLTAANLKLGIAAKITIVDADLRYRTDGTDASATVGHLLVDGGTLLLDNPSDLLALSMIRDAATDVVVSVSYFNL